MIESGMVGRTTGTGRLSGSRRFAFTVPLVKLQMGTTSLYALEIPERVTAAIGRRGPVPIVATLNRATEIQASLVPMGGGRHRLQLNTRTRGELEIEPGDPVRVVLLVPDKPPRLPMSSDFGLALREADLEESFAGLPVGKQNHIILWIEEAVRPETRAKRVAMAIQVAFRARERAAEREERRTGGK
jgi:hypothetical protein